MKTKTTTEGVDKPGSSADRIIRRVPLGSATVHASLDPPFVAHCLPVLFGLVPHPATMDAIVTKKRYEDCGYMIRSKKSFLMVALSSVAACQNSDRLGP